MHITQRASPETNSVVRDQQVELDERATNTLLRKIDSRLIPLITLLFFFAFLNRINIGNKKILN